MASSQNRLQHELQRGSSHVLRSELARRMGYSRVNEKLLAQIDNVLNDKLLGLGSAGFDFRHTGDEFMDALCHALDIDPKLRDGERERIRAIIGHREAFMPYVFVDTGFKRENQPLFVLAFMESKRRLRFDPAFRDLAPHEQVRRVGQRVRAHHRANDGVLTIWGTIQRYLFHHAEKQVLILDTTGHITGETDGIDAGRARVSVGGADLTDVLRDRAPGTD